MAGIREEQSDAESRLEHALGLAYAYLGRRDRTALEVRRHLEKADVVPAVVEAALTDLERQGYVDDERYAQRFCEDRRRLDGWGAERIEQRLLAVGVPAGIVAAQVGAAGDASELDRAVGVLMQRLTAPPEDDRARERALRLLVRRGYTLEVAYDAVRAFERA